MIVIIFIVFHYMLQNKYFMFSDQFLQVQPPVSLWFLYLQPFSRSFHLFSYSPALRVPFQSISFHLLSVLHRFHCLCILSSFPLSSIFNIIYSFINNSIIIFHVVIVSCGKIDSYSFVWCLLKLTITALLVL